MLSIQWYPIAGGYWIIIPTQAENIKDIRAIPRSGGYYTCCYDSMFSKKFCLM
jgi:hypothetical protein